MDNGYNGFVSKEGATALVVRLVVRVNLSSVVVESCYLKNPGDY
jgi:hypothetical protein